METRMSPEMTGMAMDVAMARKQKDMIEQQGAAAVSLIESSSVPTPDPLPVAKAPGVGSIIDFYV